MDMGTLSAKKINAAIQKAKNLGFCEEPVTLGGDVEVVLRSLRPDEYESIAEELKDLQGDLQVLNAFQKAHICRSICQINGVDFRGVTLVEVEEPDPKTPGQMKTFKRELHEYIRREI